MRQSWLLSAAFIGLIGESAVRCWQDSEAVAAVSGAGGKLAADGQDGMLGFWIGYCCF